MYTTDNTSYNLGVNIGWEAWIIDCTGSVKNP